MHFCPNMVWWYFAKIMSASHLFLKLYCNFSKTFIYFSISKSVYELGTKKYFDSRLLPPTKVLFIWEPKFQKFPHKYLNFEFQIIIVFLCNYYLYQRIWWALPKMAEGRKNSVIIWFYKNTKKDLPLLNIKYITYSKLSERRSPLFR